MKSFAPADASRAQARTGRGTVPRAGPQRRDHIQRSAGTAEFSQYVTRRLVADERTALIPVVAMSASPLEGREDWLEEVGFAGWLEKPIHVRTFPEQVRHYCAAATE